jgi:hypothetical protein
MKKLFIKCWRYFFCSHKWNPVSLNTHQVALNGNVKEVTLILSECEVCGNKKNEKNEKLKSWQK